MRLDKFLKVSRIIKRRTIANEACDNGRISVNDKVAKASHEVKVGDVIALQFGETLRKYEILLIKESPKKDEADNMVKVLA